ncbi:PCYCGC motif-containing (lipo)protein [Bacillus safensis]
MYKIAAKSISKFKEGKSSNEVRKLIDEEYKEV